MYRNGEILPAEPSTATTYAHAYSRTSKDTFTKYSLENTENVPPKSVDTTPTLRLAKSRTLNVLSSLTQSLSRASLGNRNNSRNVSAASCATITVGNATEATLPLNITTPRPGSSRKSSEATKEATPEIPPANINFVSTAQTSAYWAGRFQALHDRFHNEVLLPENLTTLVNAHAAHSSISKPSATATTTNSAAANPPTSIYTPSRTQQPTGRRGGPSPPKTASRIPQSATSGAILQRSQQFHIIETAPPLPEGQWRTRATTKQDAGLLLDDDMRCRRVFLHLAALCASPEALRSLHAWQQAYARRTGREALLPRGGTMEDRGAGAGNFVTRLFNGGGRRSFGGERSATVSGFGFGGAKGGLGGIEVRRSGKRLSIL